MTAVSCVAQSYNMSAREMCSATVIAAVDGRKDAPINHGPTTPDQFLNVSVIHNI